LARERGSNFAGGVCVEIQKKNSHRSDFSTLLEFSYCRATGREDSVAGSGENHAGTKISGGGRRSRQKKTDGI
jgi:hypothetical protein